MTVRSTGVSAAAPEALLPVLGSGRTGRGSSLLALALFCALLAAAAGPSPGAGVKGTPGPMHYEAENGLLSLDTQDAPLAEVLDAISASAGIEFIHSGLAGDAVTLAFERTPILDALKRLLSHRGYMIQMDPGTRRPARVWVLGRKSQALPEPSPAPPGDEERARREADRADAQALIELLAQEGLGDAETEHLIRALIEEDDGELLREIEAGLAADADRK